MTDTIDRRLEALDPGLPDLRPARSINPAWICTGEWLHLGGQLPYLRGSVLKGSIGSDLDLEAGKNAARNCAVTVAGQLRSAFSGDWSRLRQLTRITISINSSVMFQDLEEVANAASDVLVEILGERGHHTRSILAVNGLPQGAAVQIDALARISAKNDSIGLFP